MEYRDGVNLEVEPLKIGLDPEGQELGLMKVG